MSEPTKSLPARACAASTPAGPPCEQAAIKVVVGLGLCREHYETMCCEIFADPDAAPPTSPTTQPPPSVVYYLGEPTSQTVKIGTTTNLRSRVGALRAGHPGLLLLATEPGSYPLERRRHWQFRASRVGSASKEWFRKTPQLMDHVAQVRAAHGILHTGQPVPPWMVAGLKRLVP